MGFLTTIVVHNDAMGAFVKDPEGFGKAILEGINRANMGRPLESSTVGFHEYANYIEVKPSRHADDFTVYVHSGNTVTDLNPYSEDFKGIARRNPEWAEKLIKTAALVVKNAKDHVTNTKKNGK